MSKMGIQRLMGLMLVLCSVLATWLDNGDATFAVIGIPLGLWCVFTKECLLTFDDEDDRESQ